MLPLRYQLLGHLLIGLLVGALLNFALGPSVPEVERKSQPFTTQADMLAVTVLLHRNSAPEIIQVQPLPEGRVSVTPPGDYILALQDAQGGILYALDFRATFLTPGDPPRPTNDVRRTLVVPFSQEVNAVVISGPEGSAVQELTQ